MNTCPRDRQPLASNDVHGYRYYSCEECGGSWIPGDSLDRVLSVRGAADLTGIRPASVGDLFCPGCRALCDPVVIKGCHLDVCPRCHGVWLDVGEAQHVMHLFPEGSALVDADEDRAAGRNPTVLGAASVVELVGNLFVLIKK